MALNEMFPRIFPQREDSMRLKRLCSRGASEQSDPKIC